MKKQHLSNIVLTAALACALSPAVADEKGDGIKASAGEKNVATVTEDGVRSITLPSVPFELPEAPGKNLVVANCILCHSPSYITMQPAFPRKVWEAEVAKMRTTFGAPISEQHVPQIVDYLVAIRGVETEKAK